jgi:hypothetical protein
MTKIPHTNLDKFVTGRPVVIKSTATFDAGMSAADLVSVAARIKSGTVVLTGTVVVASAEITMTFPTVPVGRWDGQITTATDIIGTFAFDVIQAI